MTATKYEAICEAFRAGVPRREALHTAIANLPRRIADALATVLLVPPGPAPFLSLMHERDVPYVYLAVAVQEAGDTKKWQPCFEAEPYFRDWQDVLHFGLGLCLTSETLAPHMLQIVIALEEITEQAITLKVVGAPGTIELMLGDAGAYAAAAEKIADWMIALQSDPAAALQPRAPIGFR